MKPKLEEQPKIRKKQIELLQSYLENPGRFSVLILGNRGTGKKFWVKELFEKMNQPDAVGQVVELNAATALPEEAFWAEKLKAADKGVLIVEDVEQLSKNSQDILFQGIGTQDGTFGFTPAERYEVRIVFCSSMNIASLRDTEKYLKHKFFDRIAQLVVKFPDFDTCMNTIAIDLRHTWEKFEFKGVPYPHLLEEWLLTNAHKLHGNFRDLDKLCINWNNHQLRQKAENEILEIIIEDFFQYFHFPEVASEDFAAVYFSKDKTYDDMISDFRSRLKHWSKEQFGSLKNAAKKLGISHRTMERW